MKRFLWTTAATWVAIFGILPQAKADDLPPINARVLHYAEANLGRQVGNGECWTLADYALAYAGAQRPGTGGMDSYEFGQVVPDDGLVYPGDVIQFEGCYFYHEDDNGWSSMNIEHHTAIVAAVNGTQVTLLNENVGGDKTVQYSTIDFADLQRGTATFYRPVAQDQ